MMDRGTVEQQQQDQDGTGWTEELSETCRGSIPKFISEISASSWFYFKEICHDARSHVTMHGHMNVKKNHTDAFVQS
jgi:hypothetical protein